MENLKKGTLRYGIGTECEMWDGEKWVKLSDLNIDQTTQQKVLSWAKDRNILAPENHKNQYIKLIEEIGELSNAILKDKKEEQKDALGDVMVVLTILADQLGFDLFECYDAAYEVIKNRQGKTVNGTFIKNE